MVAANPPEKAYNANQREEFHGKSKLFVYKRTDSGKFELKQPAAKINVQKPGLRLEGIAIVKDEVWLSYDGDGDMGEFERRKLSEFGLPMRL